MFPFLKNITIFVSFHVLGMRRSVIHFVYSFASYFAIVSSPAFIISMLTSIFSRFFPIFHFPQRGVHYPCHYWWYFFGVCLYCLQLYRCHILLSRIILFVPWSYLVLSYICLVLCPVVLSSGFFLGCVFF